MRHIDNLPARKRAERKGCEIDKRVVGVLFVSFFASDGGLSPVGVSGEAEKGSLRRSRGPPKLAQVVDFHVIFTYFSHISSRP